MAGVNQHLADAAKALADLDELTGRELLPAEHDGAIRHLAETFDAVRKAAKLLLAELEGIVAASPDDMIRASRDVGWLGDNDAEMALRLVADGMGTPPIYRPETRAEIAARLHDHAALLRRWLAALREHTEEA